MVRPASGTSTIGAHDRLERLALAGVDGLEAPDHPAGLAFGVLRIARVLLVEDRALGDADVLRGPAAGRSAGPAGPAADALVELAPPSLEFSARRRRDGASATRASRAGEIAGHVAQEPGRHRDRADHQSQDRRRARSPGARSPRPRTTGRRGCRPRGRGRPGAAPRYRRPRGSRLLGGQSAQRGSRLGPSAAAGDRRGRRRRRPAPRRGSGVPAGGWRRTCDGGGGAVDRSASTRAIASSSASRSRSMSASDRGGSRERSCSISAVRARS